MIVVGSMEDTVYGTEVYSNDKAAVDASNKAGGFLLVKYTGGGTSKIKIIIASPNGISYTYDLNYNGN